LRRTRSSCILDAGQIARRLDHRHLHAKQMPKYGTSTLARELRGAIFSLGAALAEAARTRMPLTSRGTASDLPSRTPRTRSSRD